MDAFRTGQTGKAGETGETAGAAFCWPTVGQLIDRMNAVFGDRAAVVDGRLRQTFAQTARRALRLANGLRAAGYGPGERIAFLGDNSAACLEAYLAVPAAGLVLVPLNTRLAAAEIRDILIDCGARAIIAGPDYEERAGEAVQGLAGQAAGVVRIGLERELEGGSCARLIADGRALHVHASGANDLAYLYYTSGSTGRPKGVMLTNANVMAGALGAAASCAIAGHHVWLHAGPMFHLADAFAIWANFWLGGRQVCMRFAPDAAVRLIAEERVTHTLGVPTMVDMIAAAALDARTRLAGVQALFYGGAPMPAAVFARAREALDCPLVATYGMTETSGIITCAFPGEAEQSAAIASGVNVVGREAPLSLLRMVDDGGREVPAGEVGEILVRSPAVSAGYWNRPQESAEALAGSTVKTGDLGRRERDGAIALVDRKKDMIISGGENVYSREVELALEQHGAVREAAVVAGPHPMWGETVCAYVTLREGAAAHPAEVQAFVRTRLAGFKTPRRITILAELPRTGSGKIAKPELRRLAAAGDAQYDSDLVAGD